MGGGRDLESRMTEYDDLSAFRKFIEEVLDLAGLDGDDGEPLRLEDMADWSRYHPALADHTTFRRDVRQAWNALHREKPGQTYWADRLTPLELETRGVLQELLLLSVRKRFPPIDSEDTLRSVIAYTMTLSWLIRDALEEKYAPPDEGDDISSTDLSDFEF
jgi:hypothetical protein